MKNWMLIPLLAIFSGCVSYYYPAEVTDDIYYRDERPVGTDYSSSFASANYYPWWSIDYFYLGSSWGRSHSRYSIGFSHGYPYDTYYGWYDPFAWYYDPWGWSIGYPLRLAYWRPPYYNRFHDRHAWNDYYWRDRYYRDHRSRHRDHDRWQRGGRDRNHNRVAGREWWNDQSDLRPDRPRLRDQDPVAARDRDSLRRRYEDGRIPAAGRGRYPKPGQPGIDGIRSQVSIAPGDTAGKRGMEVRNRAGSKPEPTRTQPSRPAVRDGGASGVVAARPVTSPPSYASRPSGDGGNAVVRSRSGSKEKPIRIQPAPARQQHLSPVVRYAPPSVEKSRTRRGVSNGSVAVPVPKPRPASSGYYRPAPPVQPVSKGANKPVFVPAQRSAPIQPAPPRVQRSEAPARAAERPSAPSRQQKSRGQTNTASRPERPARQPKRSRK